MAQQYFSIHVKNLSYFCTQQELHDFFQSSATEKKIPIVVCEVAIERGQGKPYFKPATQKGNPPELMKQQKSLLHGTVTVIADNQEVLQAFLNLINHPEKSFYMGRRIV
jgi:hypothetical protein